MILLFLFLQKDMQKNFAEAKMQRNDIANTYKQKYTNIKSQIDEKKGNIICVVILRT